MLEFAVRCKRCMKIIQNKRICPYCGFDQFTTQDAPYLPLSARLYDGRYSVGLKTKESEIDIFYFIFDHTTLGKLLVREFFPKPFCTRKDMEETVNILDEQKENFSNYHERFLKYFRSVARFRSYSAFVPIYNIFSQNNTSYVTYEIIESTPFTEYVKNHGGHLTWPEAKTLFMPLLAALNKINSISVRHLGVCPENLVVSKYGELKLIGFSIPELRTQDSFFEPQLFDGYSAIEQYMEKAVISEATEIYGFCATLLFALTGKHPKSALNRQEDDSLMISRAILKDIPSYVISALVNGLQVDPIDRIQYFERLHEELSGRPKIIVENADPESENVSINLGGKMDDGMSGVLLVFVTAIITLAVIAGIAALWFFKNGFNSNSSNDYDSLSSYSSYSSYEMPREHPFGKKITVLDFKGKDLSEVQKAAKESEDYQIIVSDEEFSDNIEQGAIISQSPVSGTIVEKNSDIIVTVSKGKKMRSLPNIRGLSLSEASLKITSVGLKPSQTYQNSDSIPEGYIIGYEDHSVSDQMEYGSDVKIIVSTGK